MTKQPLFVFFILLLITTTVIAGEIFIDIPRGLAFTIEYSRIVRQFFVEKNQQISDYTGKWSVRARIEPAQTTVILPFEIPTIIRLRNGMTLSDSPDYGTLYLRTLEEKDDTLSKKLSETNSVTFCNFPWEFENGYLEVENREHQLFLPVYITNLGYQEKLDELMALLRSKKDGFRLLLDEELKVTPPKEYTKPPAIDYEIPLMSKRLKMIRAKLDETILLMEYTDGIWNTPDSSEKDTSMLFEAIVPGTYTVKFTTTDYITDYFITVK